MINESERISYSNMADKTTEQKPPDEVPVVNFRQVNYIVLYECPPKGLGIGVLDISRIMGVSESYPGRLLKKAGVPTRPLFKDPEKEQRRREGLTRVMSQRHDEIVSKIHAGDSDKKRGETHKRLWANNRERYLHIVEKNLRPQWEEQSRQAKVRREEKARKQAALKRENNIQIAKAVLGHERFSALPPQLQRLLILKYPTDGSGKLSLRKLRDSMKGPSHETIRQLEAEALRILNGS